MKKIFSLLIIGLVTAMLVGCSSSKNEVTACTYAAGTMQFEITYDHKGDKVLKQTQKQAIDLAEQGVSEAEMKSTADQLKKTYEAYKGISYNYTIKDGIFSEDIVIDYDNADLDALASAGIVSGEDGKAVTMVSLKQTIEPLETNGFTCKKK